MDSIEAKRIVEAASRWPEPKRLLSRFGPEHDVLLRYCSINRQVLDSRSATERWVLLTEYTFPTPIDTAWIDGLPHLPDPDFEGIGEAHRDEWAARRRAIIRARDEWRAGQIKRARIVRGLDGSGFRGIIFDHDLAREALAAHRERLQRMASGPVSELPAEPQPNPLDRRSSNPFARAPRGAVVAGRWRFPGGDTSDRRRTA